MTRRALPIPDIPGVEITGTPDGCLVIRTRGAADVDEALRRMGRREGVSWDLNAAAWRATPDSHHKVGGKLRAVAKARAKNKDS